MTKDNDATARPPAAAFKALGNETRVSILRALGAAEGPMSFTDLRERVGIQRGGEFSYHLEKLVGHYVAKTEDGYRLREPGDRLVQTIRSGAVTQYPVIEPTVLDAECYHCGAPVVLTYTGNIGVHCTRCSGNYALPMPDFIAESPIDIEGDETGFLAGYELPPAGLQGRDTDDIVRAGSGWAALEILAVGNGLCPRCAARIERSVEVCEDHDRTPEACAACGNRYAVMHTHDCTHCTYARRTQFGRLLLAEPDLLEFMTGHGRDPIAPDAPMATTALLDSHEEEVVSTDPFKGRFTFTIDGDAITLTVDDELTVVDATRHPADTPAD